MTRAYNGLGSVIKEEKLKVRGGTLTIFTEPHITFALHLNWCYGRGLIVHMGGINLFMSCVLTDLVGIFACCEHFQVALLSMREEILALALYMLLRGGVEWIAHMGRIRTIREVSEQVPVNLGLG
jgi:hypothetical protein